tara:strand:- start:251 stop:457 length:207 start_codon:yes stop_codon:yes gene_type:complete
MKLLIFAHSENRWDGAGESVDKLLTRHWPYRFGNVHNQARNLKGQIEKGKKQRCCELYGVLRVLDFFI